MIFGVISNNVVDQSQLNGELSSLHYALEFPRNEIESIGFPSGQVSLFHHPDLPLSQRDHCHLEKDLTVILSGHIYNISEFKQSTNSQAKLIALLFKEFGIECIQGINGDHAIVIIDHLNSKTYFIKNQLGTVPLSIAQKDGKLYFSSDTMGMSKALFKKEAIDDTYLKSRFFDYERNYNYTPHQKVCKVLPGHYITFCKGNVSETKYWPQTPLKSISTNFEDASIKLNELVLKAVQIRCDEEYTAGSHISGGLDSSLIAHLARKQYDNQDQFVGFTWSPKEYVGIEKLSFDERKNIKKQAEFTKLKIEYTDLTVEDYHNFVKEWRCQSEYITEQVVFRNAQANRVNLIFSGWGGDEFIGVRDEGLYYESFMKFHWKDFFKLNRKKGLKSAIMHFVNSVFLPTRRKIYFKLKISPDVFRFLGNSGLNNKNKDYSKDWYRTKTGYQVSLIEYYHLAQRCEDRYVHGQRNGIEYRYPLLDKELAEYCLSLPVELFVGHQLDRPLIREVSKHHLVEDIRSLMKLSDPVVMASSLKIQNEAMQLYKSELDQYKNNKHLSFIDFELVAREISKSDNSPDQINKKLNYLLHQIKSAHEFTIHYKA